MKMGKLKIDYALKYWIPVILMMAVIFWMSSGTFSSDNTSRFIVPVIHFLFPGMQEASVELLHGLVRKAGHLTEYFILSFLLFRAFRGPSSKRWSLRWAVSAALVSAVYAFSDEFHQSFVSTRTASFIDVGIDTAGGIIAQIVIACRKLVVRNRNYSRR
jgi:VanZ family protein